MACAILTVCDQPTDIVVPDPEIRSSAGISLGRMSFFFPVGMEFEGAPITINDRPAFRKMLDDGGRRYLITNHYGGVESAAVSIWREQNFREDHAALDTAFAELMRANPHYMIGPNGELIIASKDHVLTGDRAR